MLQSPSPSAPISHWLLLAAEGWSQVLCALPMAGAPPERHFLRFPIRFSMSLSAFAFCKVNLAKACQSVKQILKLFSKWQGANVRNGGISAVFLNAGAKASPLRQGPPCPVRPLRLNAFSLENMFSFCTLFRFQRAFGLSPFR